MNRRLLVIFVLVNLLWSLPVKADEGMWLPFLIDDVLFEEMQQMGLELSREEIFNFNASSLKDAVVHFGGGCTAALISAQGLLLTNHHCGYSRIQAHSSVDNDLLSKGFWAETPEDELPNPGLSVRFLIRAEDVTADVLGGVQSGMNEQDRNATINRKIAEIVAYATRGNHFSASVRPMFAGNEYFLFVYESFTDVRLVGAPPESIGSYGGDTDNWMWPRHTGDFSLFRVYTAPDGSPAAYSPENIPLVPRHFLPISVEGVEENDFTMILGYPGSTSRYLTSYGIEFNLDMMYPPRIDIRRRKLDIIEEGMAADDAVRIKYASKQSGIANYWKNFIGMSRSLKRLRVAEEKRTLENTFSEWAAREADRHAEYGHVFKEFERIYQAYRQFHSQNHVHAEAMTTGPDVLRLAAGFDRLAALLQSKTGAERLEEEISRLRTLSQRTYRDYELQLDQRLWAAMCQAYHEYVPGPLLPDIFAQVERKYRNQFDRYAADVYKKSFFASEEKMNRFLDKPSYKTLQKDPAYQAYISVNTTYNALMQQISELDTERNRMERLFFKGLREMNDGSPIYPDANSTMRFTYGTVKAYRPADAIYYDYYTTLSGVMEKEDPGHHEFIVPARLKDLYAGKDFGRYENDEDVVVNFIANLDITGGNSGSPVINGKGHLIGLAFDSNWEGMSGDILFDSQVQRCINVDARYILFVIEKFAGATRIMDEIQITDGR